MTTIETSAFGASGLTSVIIPNSVTSIGESAFGWCYSLQKVTIGKSVKSIGQLAFAVCDMLEEVISYIEEPFALEYGIFISNDWSHNVGATLYVPAGTKAKYEATEGWNKFQNIAEIVLAPVEKGETVDFGNGGDITENTDLNGTFVSNMFNSIGTDAGGYDSEDGCIVITKETSDEQMAALEGLDITDEALKEIFTGIIFKVPAGSGKVTVTAETMGNMTLKVKVGNGEAIGMEVTGKQKMEVPYDVAEETLVYIFAGTKGQNAIRSWRRAGGESGLRIYGISVENTGGTSIVGVVDARHESMDVYSLNGRLVRKSATSLDGLPKGAYIVNGRKVIR